MMKRFLIAMMVLGLGLPMTTSAGEPAASATNVTYYANRADFEAANPGLPVEDFNDGNVLSYDEEFCSDPYDSTTTDACWAPGDILLGVSLGSSTGRGMSIRGFRFLGMGQDSIVTGPTYFADYGYLDFPGGVAAVGFDLLSDQAPEMVDIRIFGAGGLIDSTQAQADVPGVFFGVWSSEPIVSLEYEAASGSGEALDNLTFGTTAQIFTDGFESGDTSAWSGSAP